jgi:fibrillarin-like pre-rRNA processing protein
MITKYVLPNSYCEHGKKTLIYTKSLVPGDSWFGDIVRIQQGVEYRLWDPRRSKMCAALLKRVKIPLNDGSSVLYLGSSHGYTPSFVSDIIGPKGWMIAVDSAPRVMIDFLRLVPKRNIIPILEDARHPERYPEFPKVDFLYMDVAQRDQVSIFVKHFRFLKRGSFAILMLKSRSIDSAKPPAQVYAAARKELSAHCEVLAEQSLDPFERDHCCFVVRV